MAAEILASDGFVVWQGDCLDGGDVELAFSYGPDQCNLLLVDAPYSEKTHDGHLRGKQTADRAAAFARRPGAGRPREQRYKARKAANGESGRNDLDYAAWSEPDVGRFCALWLPRTAGWVVSITDDILAPVWREKLEDGGKRFVFPPLPLLEIGSRCRLGGDGPSPWTTWVVVARPRTREFASWGTLPGAYIQHSERHSARIVGGKPLHSMMEIIRDYSRPGDLVCDPCLGGGTSLVAARTVGRRGIGMDIDVGRVKLAAAEISGARHQPRLFGERNKKAKPIESPSLFADKE